MTDPRTSTAKRPHALASIWRFKWAVLAATLLGVGAGYGLAALQPVRFEAHAEVVLRDPRDAGVFQELGPQVSDPTRHARNQAKRILSSSVAAVASERLGGRLPSSEVRERLRTDAAADLDLVTVSAWDDSAQGAAEIANAAVAAYEDVVRTEIQESAQATITELQESRADLQAVVTRTEQQLAAGGGTATTQAERDAALNELISVQSQINRLSIDAALYGSGVEFVEPAEAPERPVQPRPVATTTVGGLLGLLAGAAFSVWRGGAAQRADRAHDPQSVLKAPLLGTVPTFRVADPGTGGAWMCPTVTAPESPAAEAYRFAATAMEHAALEHGATVVVVTSANPGDGKTTTAVNLAAASHRKGRRVLLVDGDARVRGLTTALRMAKQAGLTDLAQSGATLLDAVQWLPLTEPNSMPVTPIGRVDVDPATFFRTRECRSALDRLRQWADLMVLDTPPLLSVADASAIAGRADGLIIVVDRGTPMRILEDVRERMAFIGTPLLGYVFNRGSARGKAYGYGYRRPSGFEDTVPGSVDAPAS